mmetsp:Transcript_29777/g.91949  ORF Transcript_29777/g.91949 Transcript_29777/m.91949 type:complete len:669 (-) Transcript_29777:432-2438(-)
MLFTWGSGQAMRLGHDKVFKCEKAQHARTPQIVAGLSGSSVTSVALTEQGGFAFVPSSVSSAEPTLLPTTGGARLILRGGGFWDSRDCVVRFTVDAASLKLLVLERSSLGKYVAPVRTCRGKIGKPGILCKVPRFTQPCSVFAEVAMNGKDFTTDRVRVHLYDNPCLATIRPSCCNPTDAINLTITGKLLFETGMVKVRFKEYGKRNCEWIVPGDVSMSQNDASHDNSTVQCTSPSVDIHEDCFPIETRVAVALNGTDFVTLQNFTFVIHNATIFSLVPDCRPSNPKLQIGPGDKQNEVRIIGRSFFDSDEILVKLTCGQNDYSCRAIFFDRSTLTFIPPSMSQFTNSAEFKITCAAAGEHAHQDPCFAAQEHLACALRLTFDGANYLKTSLPFVLYKQLSQDSIKAISTMCGPSTGGTCMTLQLPVFCCPSDLSTPRFASAAMRLRPKATKFQHIDPITIRAQQAPPLPVNELPDYALLTFKTPAVDFNSGAAESILSLESEHMTHLQPRSRFEENSALSTISPEESTTKLEMLVELALDGQSFTSHCGTRFTYYAAPEMSDIKTANDTDDVPVAAPGMEVSIFGRGFFESGEVCVILASVLDAGDICSVDATCVAGVVKFSMPQFWPHHDKQSNSPNQNRLSVSVSLNGGQNVTSGCLYLDLIPRP